MSEKELLGKKYLNEKSVAPEVSAAVKNKKRRIELAPADELIKKPYLNEKEVSEITGRALSTLRNDRFKRNRGGIPYYKTNSGRSIRYKISDVITWVEGRRISFDEVQNERT